MAGWYLLKAFLARNPNVYRKQNKRMNSAKLKKCIIDDLFCKIRKALDNNSLEKTLEWIFDINEKKSVVSFATVLKI